LENSSSKRSEIREARHRLRYLKDPSTGKRVSRLNPESEWIVKDVPDLRIVDDALWQAVKARQAVTSAKYANVAEGVRAHFKRNRLNGTHRPKTLLSGLIFCGCCGGPFSIRGSERFACSAHVTKGICSNNRTILRKELERRVLAGLKERMMAPEVAAEATRAYAEETNRLNRERRSNGDAWKAELVKVEKQIAQIVEAIADGMYHPSMKEKMTGLEARREELAALLADAPADKPDILPSASAIYAKKVVALTKALNRKEERQEASQDLRALIEKIVLTPGPERGELYATLHGELRTILEWTERQAIGKTAKTTKPAAGATGLSVSVVAGAGSNLHLLPEQVKMVAGTGIDHNLQSTPVKMVAGARNHLYRRSPAPNVILLIKQLEPDGSALFRAAA